MTTTTTIRIPPELKKRVVRAADRAGVTAHGFILEAIAEKAAQEESRAEFEKVAEQRYGAILSTGKTVPWDDMRRYLEKKLDGKKAVPPRPKSLGR